jgi:tetratricopeptide (TPR) repeat protein
MNRHLALGCPTLVLALSLALCGPAFAGTGDALIEHNLGLAAREAGDLDAAYEHFKTACMASDGLAAACLAWGRLAAERENTRDVKRALGSAVMLDPTDVDARYELAMMLLAKEDWTWAIEHLTEAIPHAEAPADKALLQYYLGYALFKSGELEEATKQLARAGRALPPALKQRALYYRGLIAKRLGQDSKAVGLMQRVADQVSPPDPEYDAPAAARAHLMAWTAFPRRDGFGGQLLASFGLNTHPSVAFLDDPGTKTNPTLQSIFRGDALWNYARSYSHGFGAIFTAYREQNWVELGDEGDDENLFTSQDMNITLFMLQAAYLGRARSANLEHEIRVGVDGELQFLDHVPERSVPGGPYQPSPDPFGLFGAALGGKVWWSMAADPSSIWSLRFKVEGRPNQVEADRSTVRLRLRLLHTRYFLERSLQLKLLVGGRYDRSYEDPAVIKYDRLLPEGWLDLRWTTPWPRLTVLAGGKLKYNWYLNSRQNAENSFRPTFIDNPDATADQNAEWEREYYDLTRHDFEWEASLEAAVAAWTRGTVALRYTHHSRYSNLDSAPVPLMQNETGQWERVRPTEYGYGQDLVVLEVRQAF